MKQLLLVLALGCCLPVWPASAATQVKINSDSVLEINGQKVFVVGFSCSPPADGKAPNGKNAFEELADAGATFVRGGPITQLWDDDRFEQEKKTEDAAAKYGLHCWLSLHEAGSIKGNGDPHEPLLRKIVSTFKDHPGLGVWKGADEAEWGKYPIAHVQRTYDLLKELDPDHPLALIQAPRGTVESLSSFIPACDITGFDVYPIGYPPGKHSQNYKTNSEISMVGDYTKIAAQMAGGQKSVWTTLQIVWVGVTKADKPLRFPTFHEQRFMTYQAIINGARGVTYFGGTNPAGWNEEDAKLGWNWHFWNRVLRPVVEEIGTKSPLYPALVASDPRLPIHCSAADIEFCAREVGAEIFLLACKRGPETEQISFTGFPGGMKGGNVLFEEPRTVEMKDGTLSDWFAPFEVHVYRLAKP